MEVREGSQQRTLISKPQEKSQGHTVPQIELVMAVSRMKGALLCVVCLCARVRAARERAPKDDEVPACFASDETYVPLGNLCGQLSEADRN